MTWTVDALIVAVPAAAGGGVVLAADVDSWIIERVRVELGEVGEAEAEIYAAQRHLAQLQRHLAQHAS